MEEGSGAVHTYAHLGAKKGPNLKQPRLRARGAEDGAVAQSDKWPEFSIAGFLVRGGEHEDFQVYPEGFFRLRRAQPLLIPQHTSTGHLSRRRDEVDNHVPEVVHSAVQPGLKPFPHTYLSHTYRK